MRLAHLTVPLAVALLVACGPRAAVLPLSSTPAASETASPTAALPTPETRTPSPLTIETPAIVLESIPSPTLAPVSVALPLERLNLLLPGPGSQVVSPIQVLGRGGPSWNQRVQARLVGEGGREITRSSTFIWALPEASGRFLLDLPFQIEGVAEAARLEVSTEGTRYGRLAQLTSVDLVLLSIGRPLIHPGSEGPEKLAILAPRENAVISGGSLTVRGAGWVNSDVPVRIEVVDRSGLLVGSAQVEFDSPAVGQLGTFTAEIAYSITEAQYGRIAVSEMGIDIPSLVHYSSIEVYLQP